MRIAIDVKEMTSRFHQKASGFMTGVLASSLLLLVNKACACSQSSASSWDLA
jgi:hypothetical protein